MKTTTPRLDAAWLEAKKGANAAYEAHDALSMLQAETTADLLSRKQAFVRAATILANRLQHAVERVEGAPLDHHTLNSVGEIQSSGADLDRLCVEIGVFREVLAGINSARKAAARTPEGGAS